MEKAKTSKNTVHVNSEQPDSNVAHIIGAAMIHMNALKSAKTYREYIRKFERKWSVINARKCLSKGKLLRDVVRKVWDWQSKKHSCILNVWQSTESGQKQNRTVNFIADTLLWLSRNQQKILVVASQDNVLSNNEIELKDLQPCYMEEAHDQLLLHGIEQSQLSFKKLMIVIIDTDVVVIDLYAYWDLEVADVWIEFGKGKVFICMKYKSFGMY